MVYKYRITLAGLKGFYRVYLVNASNSLYSFHKQLRIDLEFPVDQPILFKAMDAKGDVVARYALVDLGYGPVDNVTIADTIKAGAESFLYFYDTAARKSVIVTFEGEAAGEQTAYPRSIEAKGPVPAEFENGYVAFEDLPKENTRVHRSECSCEDGECHCDDCDDDDGNDSEEEDREEEELVYEEDEL